MDDSKKFQKLIQQNLDHDQLTFKEARRSGLAVYSAFDRLLPQWHGLGAQGFH